MKDGKQRRWHIRSPRSYSNTENALNAIKPPTYHWIFSPVDSWIEPWATQFYRCHTSSSPTLSQFQQFNAISYLIHTEGHDILGNASLLKEMRAFPNVSNQGSCLKFHAVALNIEYREETISESMLSRPEPVAILSARYRQIWVCKLFWIIVGFSAAASYPARPVNKGPSSPSPFLFASKHGDCTLR